MSSKKRTLKQTGSVQTPSAKKLKTIHPFFAKPSNNSTNNSSNNSTNNLNSYSKKATPIATNSVSTPKTNKTNKKPKRSSQATRPTLEAWKKYQSTYNINAKLFKYVTNKECIECKCCATRLWKGTGTKFEKLNKHANKHPQKTKKKNNKIQKKQSKWLEI